MEDTKTNNNNKTSKRTKPSVGYRNIPITNLREVMRLAGNGKYRADYPIFSAKDDRLLLQEGASVSEQKFEEMRRELWRGTVPNRGSPYYTVKSSVHFD